MWWTDAFSLLFQTVYNDKVWAKNSKPYTYSNYLQFYLKEHRKSNIRCMAWPGTESKSKILQYPAGHNKRIASSVRKCLCKYGLIIINSNLLWHLQNLNQAFVNRHRSNLLHWLWKMYVNYKYVTFPEFSSTTRIEAKGAATVTRVLTWVLL